MYTVIQLDRKGAPEIMKKRLRDIDKSAFISYAHLGVYFVKYSGTAVQLSELVGFSDERDGVKTGIVIAMGQNHGFANKDLWTWMGMS